ncbi:uncharacterized protein LOC142321114 [Lycorma delicatula]|uniref:uncharacterized protein LOC142321114 n=1 Tax=Lycorma delicatula TaxID=130591 RepID=UPI003F519208
MVRIIYGLYYDITYGILAWDSGCFLMTVLVTSKAYHYPETYSVVDDLDEDDEDVSETRPVKEDYSKYFSGSGVSAAAPLTAQPAADTSAGFVQPLEFSHFFSGNQFAPSNGVRGIVAPPTTSGIFGIPSHPMLPGLVSPTNTGYVPGLTASATNSNHSSHVGFVNPNPNVAFQALFDSAGAPTGPIYRQNHFFNPYLHTPLAVSQPASSQSMYLPHFERIKATVSHDVAQGQRQAAHSASNKKHPPPKKEKEQRYEATSYSNNAEDDEESDDEDDDDIVDDEEDAEDEDNDEEGTYVYDERKEKSPRKQTSEPHPGKSSYPVKSKSGYSKKSPFENPYPYKPEKFSESETRQSSKSNIKQPAPYKKGPVSPGSDYGYSSPFVYPNTESDKEFSEYDVFPSTSGHSQSRLTHGKPTKIQPAAAFNTKQVHPQTLTRHDKNIAFNPISQNPIRQTIYPTFDVTANKPQFSEKNIQPSQSVYTYNPKSLSPVTLQGDFIPSASIPFADNYPNAYKVPYTAPINKSPFPSTILPSNPEIKADSSQIAKNAKRCTKIEKDVNPQDMTKGRFRRQPMTCYKCHDVATGANYEQCSYDSQAKPSNYYEKESQKISAEKTVKPFTFRKKRETNESPYDFSFSRNMNMGQSITLVRKVREYTEYDDSSHTYETPYGTSEEDNYRFGPEYFKDEGDDEESDSTQAVAETESGEQCKRVKKDGIICMVCQKPSGGSYEQCSYASDPKKNSYSYGTSRTYGHGSKPKKPKRNRRYSGKENNMKTLQRRARQDQDSTKRSKNKSDANDEDEKDDEPYENPENYSESVARIRKSDKKGGVGLDPFFYGSPEETYHQEEIEDKEKGKGDEEEDDEEEGSDEEKSATSQEASPTYEDYFARLFPELATLGSEKRKKENEEEDSSENSEEDGEEEGESKQAKKELIPGFEFQSTIPEYFDDTEQRKDLEKVLGEFTQKDRSACKKVMRDKMTCYQCLDDKGMQHEECMFVAASEPKSKHLAYHEVKQFRLTPTKSKDSQNTIDDKLSNRKPVTFDNQSRETDPNYEASEENENLKNKRRTTPDGDNTSKASVKGSHVVNVDNDSQAAENLDIMRLHPKQSTGFPVSTVTIQNQRYFSSTGSSKPEDSRLTTLQRRKRLPADDDVKAAASKIYHRRTARSREEDYDDEENDGKRKKGKKPKDLPKKVYNPIPTDPPNFNIPEGPEGAYSQDTEPAFDTVLKITLPRYMLERSEHEAIFDEVLASG